MYDRVFGAGVAKDRRVGQHGQFSPIPLQPDLAVPGARVPHRRGTGAEDRRTGRVARHGAAIGVGVQGQTLGVHGETQLGQLGVGRGGTVLDDEHLGEPGGQGAHFEVDTGQHLG